MRNWPVFGQESGFIALGTSMLVLGNSLLAYLNKASTSQESLGMPFWRIVISAGIVAMVMGVINIFAVSASEPRVHSSANQTSELDILRSRKQSHCPSSARPRCSRQKQES